MRQTTRKPQAIPSLHHAAKRMTQRILTPKSQGLCRLTLIAVEMVPQQRLWRMHLCPSRNKLHFLGRSSRTNMIDFVYPYFANGDKNGELKLSIESIEKFFDGNFRITVVGDRPKWAGYQHEFISVNRVAKQPHRSFRDTFNRLQVASKSKRIGKEFVWMMDDIFFVAPLTLAELRVPRYQSIMTPQRVEPWRPSNKWLRLKKATMQELFRRGATEVRDYATHLPHVVTKQNIEQLVQAFNMPTKMFLWEVIYGNQYATIEPKHCRGFFYRFTSPQTWSAIKSNAGKVKIVNTGAYSFNRPARESLTEIISPKSDSDMERTTESATSKNKTQPCSFGFRGDHIGWRDNKLCGLRSKEASQYLNAIWKTVKSPSTRIKSVRRKGVANAVTHSGSRRNSSLSFREFHDRVRPGPITSAELDWP